MQALHVVFVRHGAYYILISNGLIEQITVMNTVNVQMVGIFLR